MPATAIILTRNLTGSLANAIRSVGLAPLQVGTLDNAVRKLKCGFFAMVLLDGECTDVDSLEFVLNVRDVDRAVPILILGSGSGEFPIDAFRPQDRVYKTEVPGTMEGMTKVLEDVLEGKAHGDAILQE